MIEDPETSEQRAGRHQLVKASALVLKVKISMPRGHTHDTTHASANTGNTLGDRSSVRQSKLYRLYESGNATKELLGTGHLQWSTTRKQGVYEGHDLYDHNNPTNETDSYNYKKDSPKRRTAKHQQQDTENIRNLSPPRRKSHDPNSKWESAGWDTKSGHKLWKEVPRELNSGEKINSAHVEHGVGANGKYGGSTANERVRAREAALLSAAGKSTPSPSATNTTAVTGRTDVPGAIGRAASNNLYGGQGRWGGRDGRRVEPGPPSEGQEGEEEGIYGPGGPEALMDKLDSLDNDELERLTLGLQQLKDMAVEAQRRDKLEKLKGELAELEASVSPQGSPARSNQATPSPPRGGGVEHFHVHFNENSTGGSPRKGILKNASANVPYRQQGQLISDSSKFYNTSFSSPKQSHSHKSYPNYDGDARVSAHVGRGSSQKSGGQLTDSSKFYNTDYASVGESHMHRIYADPRRAEGASRIRRAARERGRGEAITPPSDPGRYYDAGSEENFESSHSHSAYQQLPPDETSDVLRRRNIAPPAAKERELPAHLRTRATNDAMLRNEITPGQALRMNAPFATEATGPREHHHSGPNVGEEAGGAIRTARGEAFRSTRPW